MNAIKWGAVALLGGWGGLATVRAPAQDAAAGKAAFAQCGVCHAIDASNGVGPGLAGLIGRKAGTQPGFRFSRSMRAAGFNWDAATLDKYLADPQALVPGNVMPFAGVADARTRADLIAYLQTLPAAKP